MRTMSRFCRNWAKMFIQDYSSQMARAVIKPSVWYSTVHDCR